MLRRLALVLAMLIIALLAWFWQPLNSHALTGAAYGARIGCSCRFIEGRSIGDCRKDLKPGTRLVWLSDDEQGRSVTARFPLLASQTATFHEGQGCILEKWQD